MYNRILLTLLTVGVWASLAHFVLTAPAWSHGTSGPTLSRNDVALAVRDALRDAPRTTPADIQSAVAAALRTCTVKGRLTASDKEGEDATDFVARIYC